MAKQNIYDHETFFKGYKKIRDNDINANYSHRKITCVHVIVAETDGQKIVKEMKISLEEAMLRN